MGPGRYKFSDYPKFGVLLKFWWLIVAPLFVPLYCTSSTSYRTRTPVRFLEAIARLAAAAREPQKHHEEIDEIEVKR
jgi:hypothetical protein